MPETINNLYTEPIPADRCDWAGCPDPATAVIAFYTPDTKAIGERRPFCTSHALFHRHDRLEMERYWLLGSTPCTVTLNLQDGRNVVWTRFGSDDATAEASARAAAEREYGDELTAVSVKPLDASYA